MEITQLKRLLEALLFAAQAPLTVKQLQALAPEGTELSSIGDALTQLATDYADRGVVLTELASGYCFQTQLEHASWIAKLHREQPPRYSRALLETLAIIAYRQPVTRAEIEEIRGVTVSSSIIKTLMERQWIRVLGQREVPGRPSVYGTTKQFLDYFNLSSLQALPELPRIEALEE